MAAGLKRWFPFKENETKIFKNGFPYRNFDFKSFKNDFSSRETTSCLFKAIPAQGNGLKTNFENPLFGFWLYNRVK